MKNTTSITLRILPAALCLLFALLASNAKGQVTYYWDINQDTAGAGGPTPSGNWEDATWTTDPLGTTTPTVNWVEGSYPFFAAGSDATGNYTVTAASAHTIAGIGQSGGGTVTLNGAGILTIADGLQGFSGNVTISNVLAGTSSATLETVAGCNLSLYNVNTFGGGVNLNGGSIYLYNNSALSTGAISPILGGLNPIFSALYCTGSPLTLANNFTIGTANAGIIFVTAAGTPLTLSGNVDMQQTFYCRNAGPATGAVTFSGGVMSGPGGLVLSGNGGANDSVIVLNGANTYTGKTIIGQGGAARGIAVINSIQNVNSGIANSLGNPPDATTGQIDIGHSGFADALKYNSSSDSSTDRIINNVNTPTGGMWLFSDGAGAITYSGNITAVSSASARTLFIQGASTAANTISGPITDGNGGGGGVINVTKDGTGKWVLSGNNTYSGATTINLGTLKVGSATAIPSGTVLTVNAIGGTGTFDLGGYNVTATGASSAGNLDNSSGTATLTLNAVASALTYSGVIQNTAPGVLNMVYSGSGSGSTPGQFNFNATPANTYTGKTTVKNAVLQIQAESNLGATPGPGVVTDSITLDQNLGFNAGTGANANNYYLRLQSTAAVSLSATRGIYLGTTLGYGGGMGAQSGKTLTVNGPISGPGGLWIGGGTAGAGIGAVVLANTGNTYGGGTYIVGGTLKLGDNNTLPTGTSLWMGVAASGSGTYFDMNGKSQTIGPLTGFGTPNGPQIKLTGALTIKQTANTTFIGFINKDTGGGSLTLDASSTGTLTLAQGGAANNYIGPTAINGGTLALSGTVTIGTSTSITVGRGATFDVSGLTTALTLGTSQTLKAGGTSATSATIATASGKGLTLGTASPLQFTAYDGTTVPLTITGAGSLAIGTGNAVTVTTTTQLGVGSHKLVQIGSGNTTAVTGTPASSVTVNGSGIVSGTFASLRVTGGELYLDVQNLAPVTGMSIGPGGGGNLTISYSGGAGSQFVLLQTNNVAAPMINWTRLKTNPPASSSFTITPGSDPMEFYRIKSE